MMTRRKTRKIDAAMREKIALKAVREPSRSGSALGGSTQPNLRMEKATAGSGDDSDHGQLADRAPQSIPSAPGRVPAFMVLDRWGSRFRGIDAIRALSCSKADCW